jgi:hypothetical protein
LQSYSAHSFYLPVPEVKEIISKRVNFLKSKLEAEPGAAQSYFSRLGFRVQVNDLAVLADAVGKVFVENDYVSGLIGRLGNFDIRRILKITERVFLSPEMKIDDIIKSRFGGESVVANPFRAHRALIRGEYDRFDEAENEFISNLFQTDPQRPGPPLLGYYILWLLRQKQRSVRPGDDDIERRHWLVIELCQFFEPCGVPEDIVVITINRLHARRLIEALDPNAEQVSVADRVAIKESGIAHLELVLNSAVYVEQMALVTGLSELSARDEIRSNLQQRNMPGIRDAFLRYVLKIDHGRLGIPSNRNYSQVTAARGQVAGLTTSGDRHVRRRQAMAETVRLVR